MTLKKIFVIVIGGFLAITCLPNLGISNDFILGNIEPDAEKMTLISKSIEGWNAVASFEIEYEAVVRDSETSQDRGVHKVLAMSPPSDLYEMSAHFSSNFPWQEDPFCQELFIHQGISCHQWPIKRKYMEYSIHRGDSLPGTAAADMLFTIIPKWPLIDYKIPSVLESGVPLTLLEALRSSQYHLLSRSETVAGENCDIFENGGTEQTWIAIDKGMCVMRRDFRNADTGKLIERELVDKVYQVAPGLWFPKELRRQIFSTRVGTNDILVQESRIKILRCELNDNVPTSVFVATHLPGSIKYEEGDQFKQIIPGGEDLLSSVVNYTIKYSRLPNQHDHAYRWLLGGVISGICLVFIFLKRKAI